MNLLCPARHIPRSIFLSLIASVMILGTDVARSNGIHPDSFSRNEVIRLAQELSKRPYESPRRVLTKIGYNDYLTIRAKPDRVIWSGERLGFELHPMPLGGLFDEPVEVNVVVNGNVTPVTSDVGTYQHSLAPDQLPSNGDLGISGFRITGPLNHAKIMDEILVFQGASYFRALSKGQVFGISARGLGVDTARPRGEDFPDFRRFWIEKPKTRDYIVVHALLDSQSATGAYRFVVWPGKPTIIEVDATLFPRRELTHIGIAPLTSMFLVSTIERSSVSDFRPEVHDSDGLAIYNGNGERLWRPLQNHRRLEVSEFLDANPRGFGLIQRQRDFASYQDLEARFDLRPSVWVEPRGPWGKGRVELVEIPSNEEIHDNIVAYWRPTAALPAGQPYELSYRLSWPDSKNWSDGYWVKSTFAGAASGADRGRGAVRFVIDYLPPPRTGSKLPAAHVSASAGDVGQPTVQTNPQTGGVRVSFILRPNDAVSVELRLTLEEPNAEVWLYRWTRGIDAP